MKTTKENLTFEELIDILPYAFDVDEWWWNYHLMKAHKRELSKILEIMMQECDRTENEGGRLLVEWYRENKL